MVLLITYDLNKAKDYPKLYQAIKDLGDWCRDPDLDSVWFVSTSLSVYQVSDLLNSNIDPDDRLFVTKLHTNEFAGWLHKDVWSWIHARV